MTVMHFYQQFYDALFGRAIDVLVWFFGFAAVALVVGVLVAIFRSR